MKKYKVIYADPPWAYKVWSKKGAGRSAESHYPTMDIAAIKALPVEELAAKCYCHLEALSRREADMERYLPLFENAVVVCREVGGGIVPMDGAERAWRERHGTFMQELARRADHVTRVFCGLTEGLK